mmetsp:Transcript_6722/g.14738  ORF Transcript_6722/g.14738 Transcript_6722/m.14738 type:complete len:223 (-) Transcript_6722:185-853(-)
MNTMGLKTSMSASRYTTVPSKSSQKNSNLRKATVEFIASGTILYTSMRRASASKYFTAFPTTLSTSFLCSSEKTVSSKAGCHTSMTSQVSVLLCFRKECSKLMSPGQARLDAIPPQMHGISGWDSLAESRACSCRCPSWRALTCRCEAVWAMLLRIDSQVTASCGRVTSALLCSHWVSSATFSGATAAEPSSLGFGSGSSCSSSWVASGEVASSAKAVAGSI